MIQGNGSTSLRKQDVASQKTPALGFKKIVFAHQATAGATTINLNSLTTPTGMVGFTNATQAELKNAQLLFYRKNLTLISSLRGVLADFMSYNVTGNMQITFTDDFGTALEGEVFIGTIDHSAMTGSMVVDAEQIGASGQLTAGTTDFNVGTPFTVGAYSNRQFGEVMVFLDGVLQTRNTSNSSVTLDGNYYEVDSGNGMGTLIRFNVVDPSNDRDVVVAGIGVVAERPNGSMMSVIESVAGKLDSMASVVSDLSGLTTFQITGANPTSPDLKAFGDRVLAIESNRARIDQNNVWTSTQSIPGRTDGASVLSGFPGERVEQSWAGTSATSGSYVDIGSQQILGAGIWLITWSNAISLGAGGTASNQHGARLVIDAVNGITYGKDFQAGGLPTANFTGACASGSIYVNKSTSWTLKAQATASFSDATAAYYGSWTAVRIA